MKPTLRLVESTDEFHCGVWKKDDVLVLSADAVFNDRCIRCNAPADGISVRKILFWHSPLLLPLLVLSFPFYLLLAIFFKRTVTAQIPLCSKHHRMQLAFTLLAVFMLPAFPAMGIYAVVAGKAAFILIGLLTSLAGLALLGWARNPIWAISIRGEYAVIQGANPEFSNAYPEWDHHIQLK